MLDRVVALLAPRIAGAPGPVESGPGESGPVETGPGETYADATAGLGGHAVAIARAIAPAGTVILNDLDAANLAHAQANVAQHAPGTRVVTVNANFAGLPHAPVFTQGARANMLLADLGFASSQVDDPARGFSFSKEGPLDMRFGGGGGAIGPGAVSAADLVNGAPEAELARIIDEFGEERYAKAIARRIVQTRAASPIHTTTQLAELIRGVVRATPGLDPATRTFQALRIAVNDEMGSLDAFLSAIMDDAKRSRDGQPTRWLAPGARVVIISFHSLEDRRVKAAFARGRKDGTLAPIWPESRDPRAKGPDFAGASSAAVGANDLARLGLDQIAEPTDEEIRANPRARSAKVRAARLALPK
jgi:16S rRNA (cytosine1402-N4)-methyltransferase